MIASLMLYATMLGLLLALVGIMADHSAALCGATRRWLWAGVLGASVALPLITPWRAASSFDLNVLLPFSASVEGVGRSSPARWTVLGEGLRDRLDESLTTAASFDALLLPLWLASSALVAAVCLSGYVVITGRRRGWRESLVGAHRVLIAPDTGPAVVGLINPRIVLPEWTLHLDDASVNWILRHEQEHVRAGDPWLIHFSTAALLAMPWNPFVWWMASRLRLAVELDCDTRVLARGSARHQNAEAYGELLLTVAARRPSHSPLVVPALIESSSTLTRRISAMFPGPIRFAATRITATAACAVALALVAATIPAPRAFAQAPPRDAVQPPAGTPAPSSRPFGEGAYRAGSQPQFRAPVVVHNVKPRYTPEAMQNKIAGRVILEAVVEVDGTVSDTRITKSLDTEHGLDREALAAARQWTFKPGTMGDVAVPTIVELVMEFWIH